MRYPEQSNISKKKIEEGLLGNGRRSNGSCCSMSIKLLLFKINQF